MKQRIIFGLLLAAFLMGSCPAALAEEKTDAPNIVYILADDLGYGSLNCYGADRELVRTPHIDRLAREGMRFSNAVTAGAFCSPTRYGLMMGRYHWRTDNKRGGVGVNAPLWPDPQRESIASWLNERGYRTAVVGKWHLGFGNKRKQPRKLWTEKLAPGPIEMGFDYNFNVPQNHGDNTGIYIKNHFIWGLESKAVHPYSKSFYGHQYYGFDAPQRVNKEVMARLTDKAVNWLKKQRDDKPFFLYFASVAVHHPITPSDRMRGESGSGPYGDFIQDLDLSVGRIMQKLERMGVADDTLVIFTSDNGGDIPGDRSRPERQAMAAGLEINGELRGDKHTIWEGGVRVPFIARWPGKIPAGQQTDTPISLNDSFATLTEIIAGETVPAGDAAPDSFSFASTLRGQTQPGLGHPTVISNVAGILALRWGPWKYIEGEFPEGVWENREGKRRHFRNAGQTGRQLYHLGLDRSEQANLHQEMPQLASQMQRMLDAIREHGSTRQALAEADIAPSLKRHIRQIDRSQIKEALAQAGSAKDQ